MIVDFDDLSDGGRIQADLCVIGSGAAGITIAREFLGTDIKVVLLEGGGGQFETASQEPYRSVVSGLPHRGVHDGRARVLGGTTTLWAGQALPLFEMDFTQRDWVPHSGWPVTRSELTPYYFRAEEVMQIPHRTYDRQSWPREELPQLESDGALEVSYSQFASVPDFAKKYRKELVASVNITVLTHANAIRLEPAEDSKAVTGVQIKSFTGKTARVSAQFFVICCGGIDSARLLLASDSVQPAGLGNQFDNVGRFFQDHPSLSLPITPRDPLKFDEQFGAVRLASALSLIKIHPSTAFQRENRILNIGAEVVYSGAEGNPLATLRQIKGNLMRGKIGKREIREISKVARHPRELLHAAYWRCVSGNWQSPARLHAHLFVSCEQEPNRASRILLSEERDSLGMKKAIVDWRLTKLVTISFDRFLAAIAKQWKELNIASLNVADAQLQERETGLSGGFADINHHMGTTRMGDDPKNSVVDSACRVHGYRNLYVGSSSVFPTSGFSNPTLTVIALCLRISDHIKSKIASDLSRDSLAIGEEVDLQIPNDNSRKTIRVIDAV